MMREREAMRRLKAQAAETRDRIIAEAARLFRERGFAGIGVAELMRRVGLTHGGFYGHFASKEELMALACRRAVDDMLVDWRRAQAASPADPLGAIVRPYLSNRAPRPAGHRMPDGGRSDRKYRARPRQSDRLSPTAWTMSSTPSPARFQGRTSRQTAPGDPAVHHPRRRHGVGRAVADLALSDSILRTVDDALAESRSGRSTARRACR